MKKRTLRMIGLVAAVLLLSFLLVSCANEQPAALGSGDGTGVPPPPQDDGRTWGIIMNKTFGEGVSPGWVSVFNELEERSGGRFDMTTFFAQSLLTIPEIPMGMFAGAASFSNLPSNNYVDILPLNTRILTLPFMGLQDPITSAEIYMQLYNEFPEMREEMAQFNMMVIGAATISTGYDLFLVDQNEIRLPADLAGRRLVPFKLELLPLFEANNASSTQMPPGQIYEGLERGVIDGYVNMWAFKSMFGLADLIHQHVKFGDYGMFHEYFLLVMNTDLYAQLPEDLRQLWHDVFWYERGFERIIADTMRMVDYQVAAANERAARGDFLLVELTDAELQVWREALLPTHETALAEINAARGDTVANDIYNRALELIAERFG